MRSNVLEKYLSQDGNLHATVVAVHDGGRSATFKLRSGEQQFQLRSRAAWLLAEAESLTIFL
jgi:hypothetical protein